MSIQDTKFGDLEQMLEQSISLKISLVDAQPKIWRRVHIPAIFSLGHVHDVIQICMGWENSHLHCFRISGNEYSAHYDGDPEPFGENADDVLLLELGAIEPGFRFEYEYDFGDSWMHTLLLEKVLEPEPGQQVPVCIKGKRACPPEDVGGVWGYEGFLEAIGNPDHPEHEEYLEWIGGEFDPEVFDLVETNAMLQELR